MAIDPASSKPLYRQVYEGYRAAMVDGRLRPGQRLPSSRTLARELGISRLPVTNAFEQLLAEGYCETRVGAGTFVARTLPEDDRPRQRRQRSAAKQRASGQLSQPREPRPPGARQVSNDPSGLIGEPEPWVRHSGAFSLGDVALESFTTRTWGGLVARHARRADPQLLRYGEGLGYRPFREALAAYLRAARGVRCDADQLMVVSGSQQALGLAARVLLDPGDSIWMEDPGYWGARNAFAVSRARLQPVPVDELGLDVAAGIALAPNARAVYVTPSHQMPLGVTMGAPRRLHLLDWAQASGAWILEDDYNSEYRYESQPVTALQGLDRDDRVIYLGTLSKVLFPALRIGYVVVPRDLLTRFLQARRVIDLTPPVFLQAVLADFISEGHFARHLRRAREIYRRRRSALVAALDEVFGDLLEVRGAQAGMHLAAVLKNRTDDRAIALRAADDGLWVMPLSHCTLDPVASKRRGFVLGYGGVELEEIPAAVRRLRAAYDSV